MANSKKRDGFLAVLHCHLLTRDALSPHLLRDGFEVLGCRPSETSPIGPFRADMDAIPDDDIAVSRGEGGPNRKHEFSGPGEDEHLEDGSKVWGIGQVARPQRAGECVAWRRVSRVLPARFDVPSHHPGALTLACPVAGQFFAQVADEESASGTVAKLCAVEGFTVWTLGFLEEPGSDALRVEVMADAVWQSDRWTIVVLPLFRLRCFFYAGCSCLCIIP